MKRKKLAYLLTVIAIFLALASPGVNGYQACSPPIQGCLENGCAPNPSGGQKCDKCDTSNRYYRTNTGTCAICPAATPGE